MSLRTGRDSRNLPSSEHDVPEPLTPDNGDVESSHEQAVFNLGLCICTCIQVLLDKFELTQTVFRNVLQIPYFMGYKSHLGISRTINSKHID